MPFQRLQAIPWHALEGLTHSLTSALAAMLGGEAAERVLDEYLRQNHPLSAEQRTAAAEAIFGVGLWRRRLAYHLGERDGRNAEPPWLLFSLLRDLASVPAERAASLTGIDSAAAPPVCPAPNSLADRWSLPDWLADLLSRELGEAEAHAFAQAINQPGPICIRTNTLKTTRAALVERLRAEGVEAAPTRYAPWGLTLSGRPNIFGLRAYQEGLFETQDEGSQLIGNLLDARPGERVLDLCAGAGGKSLLLSAQMRNEGALYAYDTDREKLERLRRRAHRAGATNIHILSDGILPTVSVDRVLIDAPCSSLGALRRGPDVRFRLDPRAFDSFPAIQRNLLETATRHLRARGTVLYATCTLRREENEEVCDWFEETHPDFSRVLPGPEPSFHRDSSFLCLPHRHNTDGFFATVFLRKG